jgi:hypothetical protein
VYGNRLKDVKLKIRYAFLYLPLIRHRHRPAPLLSPDDELDTGELPF